MLGDIQVGLLQYSGLRFESYLNHRDARTSVDLRFNRFIFFESTINRTKPQDNEDIHG